jgi:hypothetical protein
VRKNFADSRIRVKGRFVKKEEQVRCLYDCIATGSETHRNRWYAVSVVNTRSSCWRAWASRKAAAGGTYKVSPRPRPRPPARGAAVAGRSYMHLPLEGRAMAQVGLAPLPATHTTVSPEIPCELLVVYIPLLPSFGSTALLPRCSPFLVHPSICRCGHSVAIPLSFALINVAFFCFENIIF